MRLKGSNECRQKPVFVVSLPKPVNKCSPPFSLPWPTEKQNHWKQSRWHSRNIGSFSKSDRCFNIKARIFRFTREQERTWTTIYDCMKCTGTHMCYVVLFPLQSMRHSGKGPHFLIRYWCFAFLASLKVYSFFSLFPVTNFKTLLNQFIQFLSVIALS